MKKRLVIVVLLMVWQAAGLPVISEFMASNETTLADEDGDFPDWIELHNPTELPLDLTGYRLTDEATDLAGWVIPPVILEAGEWLVIFASGKDRIAGELHTDFRLSASGESLALIAPDGLTVVSDFGPLYPPQFEDQSYGRGEFGVGYFDEPTPGAANGSGRLPGPLFLDAQTGGPRPPEATGVAVNARVQGAENVTVFFRSGFGQELSVLMTTPDGENFNATIAGGLAGELIRWRFVAEDADGRVTRDPPFADPGNSPEYYGVPVVNPEVTSQARVMEWFIHPEDYNKLIRFQIRNARAGIYFEGEYYDNVRVSLRGQSTLFFDKKGFSLNFNRTQRFLWQPDGERIDEIDLMTNWGDKAKVRNEMAYEILRESGVPTHLAETIRLQQNGQFFSLTDMVDDGDEIYLDRVGLNPEGTLYKADNTALRPGDITTPDIVRILAGEDEGLTDLHALIRGLNQDDPDRWAYIFDRIDLPMTINTLAGLVVIMQTDMGAKNYYLYHDATGSGEWAILPWDLDLTFGRNYTNRGGYFDRNLFFQDYTEFAESQNTSTLVEALLRGNPRTRAMFFRRLRTLADQFLNSPYIPQRTVAQLSRLDTGPLPTDALRDSQKWGTWFDANFVPQPWDPASPNPDMETMAEAVGRLIGEWLPARIEEVYENVPDLPEPVTAPRIRFGALDFDPVSDNQEQEFVELVNLSPTAVDLSGWRVDGAVRMTLPPGTVLPTGGTLYLSPDKAAFLTRELSPTGGEQRFVLAPYAGNLAAEGETLELYDPDNLLHDSHTFSGRLPGFNGNSREDHDNDGLNALFEWALGTSDREANSLPFPVNDTLTYQVRSNLNGYGVLPEISTDLQEWSSTGVVETARTPLDNDLDQVTIAFPPDQPRAFVRLRLIRL